MKHLDRYLLAEILVPWGVGLAAFVVMITGHMLFTVVDQIVQHGVGMPSVLKFMALQVPFALTLSLPAATLLATSLALNRLASENELTAMRAAGISLTRLLAPVLGVGLLASGAALVLGQWAVPWSNHQAQMLLQGVIAQRPVLVFRPGKFTHTEAGLDFFAESVDRAQGQLGNLYVFQRSGAEAPRLLWAPSATFGDRDLRLSPGYFYQFTPGGSLTWGQTLGGIRASMGALLFSPGLMAKQTGDLSLGELLTRRAQLEAEHPGAGRPYSVELHWRIALAFSCLVFALLALPVTLSFARGQSLVGVLATLLLVFGYYVVMLWVRMATEAGPLSPLLGAWLENGVLVVVALALLVRRR